MARFGRRYEMEIGKPGEGVRFNDLHVSFDIKRKRTSRTGKADFEIFNPSETIIRMAQKEGTFLRFKAGYASDETLDVLYLGDITKSEVRKQQTDVVLSIEGGDGQAIIRKAQLNRTFGRNTSKFANLTSVIDAIGNAGIKVNNAKQILSDLVPGNQVKGISKTAKGEAVSGLISNILSDYLRDYNIVWTIYNGELILSSADAPSPQYPTATLLTYKTGLLDMPVIGERGIVSFKSLLNPSITPMSQIVIKDTKYADGNYIVTETHENGSYRFTDWYTQGKALLVKSKPSK